MIKCQACPYQALGPVDLTGHLKAVHGFSELAAQAEAGRIAGGVALMPSSATDQELEQVRAELRAWVKGRRTIEVTRTRKED